METNAIHANQNICYKMESVFVGFLNVTFAMQTIKASVMNVSQDIFFRQKLKLVNVV